VDVVLDAGEPHHPAVALQGVERAEHRRDDVGIQALPFQAEQAVVQGLEMPAGVLDVDGEELRRDLKVRHS